MGVRRGVLHNLVLLLIYFISRHTDWCLANLQLDTSQAHQSNDVSLFLDLVRRVSNTFLIPIEPYICSSISSLDSNDLPICYSHRY